MEAVLRAAVIYLFLMVVFRVGGRRTLAQMTAFDMILLLLISEAVSNALASGNPSLTHAFILVVTLVLMELGFAWLKGRSDVASRLLDDVPLILVENGTPLTGRMDKARVEEDDILEAARGLHGLENMRQVKYAVLERDGSISVIPESSR
ncbi:DUF421 domain-containing protein [Lysobacter sp. GX 14042]|uniref:DUF421 domain-containing protein n=1 Tax=Lysobacter sp. GX 14042 TaxID=2907155 RepID=UPI001F448A21|nr:YetF domain-containing protein [Lysobacter sp. GX 14042]MCE7032383.1 DUF421 domain-containing protein [Lysobacter sp. GX 14042]